MKSALVGGAVLLLVAACSSESQSTAGGPCAQRSGTYLTAYSQRSGTCGPVGERIVQIPEQPTSVDPPCTGSISYSADNCEVTYQNECPANEVMSGARLQVSGKSRWDAAGATGNATEQWTLTNATGQTLCISTYDVTVTRQ